MERPSCAASGRETNTAIVAKRLLDIGIEVSLGGWINVTSVIENAVYLKIQAKNKGNAPLPRPVC